MQLVQGLGRGQGLQGVRGLGRGQGLQGVRGLGRGQGGDAAGAGIRAGERG